MDAKVTNTQIALMYQTAFIGSFDAILDTYKSKINPDVAFTKFPIPEEMPGDIPRLEIKDQGGVIIRFAKSRADLLFNSNVIDEAVRNSFFEIVLGLKVVVGRVGFVQKTLYSAIDYYYVREKFHITDEMVSNDNDILEAFFKFNKATKLGEKQEYDCNNIASLSLGKLKDDALGVQLERDVNTKGNKNLAISDVGSLVRVINTLSVEANNPLIGV